VSRLSDQRIRAHSGSRQAIGSAVIVGGLVLTAVAVAGQTAAQLVDFEVYHLRIDVLNSDQHASIFGIASICANGAVAVVAAVRATNSDRRASWALVSVLVAVAMVLRIANAGDGDPLRYILLLPLVSVLVVLLWSLTSAESESARVVARTGIALLVFSYVVHVVGPGMVPALSRSNSWAYEAKGVLKHDGELAGWILLATGLAAYR
jgi:hypothetical protein